MFEIQQFQTSWVWFASAYCFQVRGAWTAFGVHSDCALRYYSGATELCLTGSRGKLACQTTSHVTASKSLIAKMVERYGFNILYQESLVEWLETEAELDWTCHHLSTIGFYTGDSSKSTASWCTSKQANLATKSLWLIRGWGKQTAVSHCNQEVCCVFGFQKQFQF